VFAVDVNVRHRRRRFKSKVEASTGIASRNFEAKPIPRGTAMVVVAAVLTVGGVPGMWKLDCLPARGVNVRRRGSGDIIPHELPTAVEDTVDTRRRRATPARQGEKED
jgi:hypothetical protein